MYCNILAVASKLFDCFRIIFERRQKGQTLVGPGYHQFRHHRPLTSLPVALAIYYALP